MDNPKPSRRSPRSLVRGAILCLTLIGAAGCGDAPSREAGTIELPERKPEPVNAKNWTKPGKTSKPSQR